MQQRNAKNQLLKKITQQDSHWQTHKGLSFENPQAVWRLWLISILQGRCGSLASGIFFCFGSDSKSFQRFVQREGEMQNLLRLFKVSTVESKLLDTTHKLVYHHG